MKNLINKIKTLKEYKNTNELSVVCVGLYNHGKSSLLNTLVDDFNFNTFKVADKRETSTLKKIKKGNFIFVDTPGLDALEKDDKKVFEGIVNKDIVLFVHNVATGELVQNEIDFLYRLKKEFEDKNIKIVLSRIDQVDENILTQIKEKIKTQLNGLDVEIFEVSVNRYKKGKLENKNLLIKKGGVDEIKEMLNSLDRYKVRQKRVEYLKQKLLNEIAQEKEKIDKKLKEVKADKNEIKRDIRKTIQNLKQQKPIL